MMLSTLTRPAMSTGSIAPVDATPLRPANLQASLPTRALAPEAREDVRRIEDQRRKRTEPAVAREMQILALNAESLIAQARKSFAAAPSSTTAAVRLAVALLSNGRIDEARDIAEAALAIEDLSDEAALHVLATVFLALDDRDNAEACLRNSLSVAGSQLLLAEMTLEQGEAEKALAMIQHLQSPEAHAFRGYILLTLNRYGIALHELRSAQGASRHLSGALMGNISYALAALGSTKKAVRASATAIALSPYDPDLRVLWAESLIRSGNSAEASARMKRWRSDPLSVPTASTTMSEANALIHLGDWKNALQVFRSAALDPRFNGTTREVAELDALTAYTEYRIGRTDRQSLIVSLRRLLRDADGKSLRIACILADALQSRTDAAEIRAIYDGMALSFGPTTLLPLLARVQGLACDSDQQAETLREWAKVAPLDPTPFAFLVGCLTNMDRFDEAARVGLQSLQRFPGEDHLRNNTAYALAMLRRPAEAAAVLDGIGEIVPDPYVTATRALIALANDDVDGGLAGYRRAAEIAQKVLSDPLEAEVLATLLGVQLRIVIRHLDIDLGDRELPRVPLIPEGLRDRPDVEVMRSRARRANLPWV